MADNGIARDKEGERAGIRKQSVLIVFRFTSYNFFELNSNPDFDGLSPAPSFGVAGIR